MTVLQALQAGPMTAAEVFDVVMIRRDIRVAALMPLTRGDVAEIIRDHVQFGRVEVVGARGGETRYRARGGDSR